MLRKHHFLQIIFLCFFSSSAFGVTLTSGQTDYSTTSDITTDSHGITSSFSGTSSSLRKITNFHVITTGNDGAVSGSYGIRSSGDYNKITNSSSAEIITTGSSGRGISVSDFSEVYNQGSITTQGTTSYGIYLGGDSNTAENSGSITTSNSTAYGIYLNGDSNMVTNSGVISTEVYGIYGAGNENEIENSGSITTSNSSSAHGIYISAASSSTATSTSYNMVENSGTISSSGNGIYVKDDYTQITNSGTITSASTSSIYGIKNEGDNATITNSGTINSQNYAIYNLATGVTINNSGTLNADVFLGNATLNILGGSLEKVVGNSTSSIVNIGSDSSSISFDQDYDFSGLTSFNVKTDNVLNSYASISADEITLSSGAILNLYDGSNLSAAIIGSDSSSGTLNLSGVDFSSSYGIGTSSNKIENLNINSTGSLSVASDVYVANLNVNDGSLNLNETDGLTIFGNLSGGGNAVINLGANSQTIDGNFTLVSGDSLSVMLDDNVGNLTVLGDVNIDENANLIINTSNNSGYIVSGSTFEIINASGSLSAFSSDNISINGSNSNQYGLLTYSTQSSSDSVILTINRLASSQVTSNENARNIYENINAIGASSSKELQDFQVALDNSEVSSNKRTKIINQLAPQSSKAMILNNIDVVNNSFRSAENRLDKMRLQNLKNGFWLENSGFSATQDEVKDDEGYKVNSFGFALGADKEIDEKNIVGILFNYSKSNIVMQDSLKKNFVNSYQVNIYNSQNFGSYFFDSLAAIVLNQYNSSKSIELVSQNSQASFQGQSYATKIKGGKVVRLQNNWNFIPEIMLNFVRSNIGAYSEKNAGTLNLNVEKVTANFLESRVGLNLRKDMKLRQFPEFSKVMMNFGISYGVSLINDTPNTISNFENQISNFQTKISNVDKESLQIKSELVAYQIDNLSFGATYNFEKKETSQSHFVSLKLKQIF